MWCWWLHQDEWRAVSLSYLTSLACLVAHHLPQYKRLDKMQQTELPVCQIKQLQITAKKTETLKCQLFKSWCECVWLQSTQSDVKCVKIGSSTFSSLQLLFKLAIKKACDWITVILQYFFQMSECFTCELFVNLKVLNLIRVNVASNNYLLSKDIEE